MANEGDGTLVGTGADGKKRAVVESESGES